MNKLVFIAIVIIVIGTGYVLYNKNQTNIVAPIISPSPVVSVTQVSPVSCQVCGPQGIHNVEGNTCSEGYICKQGKTTTASYCVKENEDVSICETPIDDSQ